MIEYIECFCVVIVLCQSLPVCTCMYTVHCMYMRWFYMLLASEWWNDIMCVLEVELGSCVCACAHARMCAHVSLQCTLYSMCGMLI